jgi:hypothetical protein
MLNCGFVISTRPDNDLNPMTALIAFVDSTSEYKKEYKQMFQLLIDHGVNLESWLLFVNMNKPGERNYGDSFDEYKTEMYISDAIYLYMNTKVKNKLMLIKLLSHWWAPPLALLTFTREIEDYREHQFDMIPLPTRNPANLENVNAEPERVEENVEEEMPEHPIPDENAYGGLDHPMPDGMSHHTLLQTAIKVFDTWFDFLADYGGIPHGTNMYKEFDAIMEYWKFSAKNVNMEHTFAPYMTRYKELTSEYVIDVKFI